MFIERIREELKKAILSKDILAADTLRLAIAAVKNREIQKGQNLTEEDILEVIAKEVKKRDEAIEGFKKGKRMELVAKEETEKKILLGFLPQPLSQKELKDLIEKEIEKLGTKDFGSVMKAVMPEVKGKAEGKVVSQMVKELFELN